MSSKSFTLKMAITLLISLVLISITHAQANQALINGNHFYTTSKFDIINSKEAIQVNILLLLPTNDTYKFSMSKVTASLDLAKQDLKQTDYGRRFQLNIKSDVCDCGGIRAPVNAMENIYRIKNNSDVFQAVFGPMCDYSLAPVARYAPFWNVAVITVSATAQDFRRNKFNEYKTLTNIGPTMYWLDKFVKKVFRHFDWKRTMFLFDKDYQEKITNSNCYLTMASLKAELLNAKISVDYKIRDKQDPRPMEKILKDYVSNKFSVILLCGSTEFVYDIMTAAKQNGFLNGEYAFINFDLYAQMHSEDRLLKPWKTVEKAQGLEKGLSSEVVSAYEGLLTVTLKIDDTKNSQYRAFQKRLATYSPANFKDETEVNYFLASFYDAMHIYVNALNHTIMSSQNINDIPAVLSHIWNKDFEGITGKVVIDNYGERMGEFVMLDLNPKTLIFEPVISSAIGQNSDVVLTYNESVRPIYWQGMTYGVFPDSPKCGYPEIAHIKCPIEEPLPPWVWLLISMSILMAIMCTIGIIFYKRAQFEAELNAMSWLIKWEDVNRTEENTQTNQQRKISNKKQGKFEPASLNQLTLTNTMDTKSVQLVEQSDKLEEVETVSLLSLDARMPDSKVVKYKRNWCYLKSINKSKLEINRSLLLEVKKIKDLQNEHITRFIGICLHPSRQFIFTEYCQKGSLQDILENKEIELETSFKHHLMHDIIKGMLFIHGSEIKCHGNLTSANCVVDSRFTLKITDFGVPSLYTTTYASEEAFYKKMLWKAPELHSTSYTLVNSASNSSAEGTQKGDVYSFAIIMQEILYRNGVFYLNNEDRKANFKTEEDEAKPRGDSDSFVEDPKLKYRDIFKRVKFGLRPSLETYACSKEIIELLKRCWSASVQDRPDFHIIKDCMRKTTKISGNILDNLLARMEKYANNLEDLVQERTVECDNERKRAETLLYRLLPPTVAADLMNGNEVKAETFSEVTIYFSDICGFTDLSAKSTPMQVVCLLNGLYTLFDSIVEEFDVYKVETIGDAYMVVSGLPKANRNHASDIARMSLALLDSVENFKIPHLPEKKLELRIGLHSGSCVAGVVGLKMPRYCLFGDTVNTASRMESNGAALRIHISPQTKEALDSVGTFDIALRGPVEMKGKGSITTYWLLGENGRIVDRHRDSRKDACKKDLG